MDEPSTSASAPLISLPDDDVKVSKKEEEDLLKEARKNYDLAAKYWSDNFEAALDDLKFNVGDHWGAQDAAERELAGRPMITVNRTPTLVNQVTNELRQNRPAINISPDSDLTDAKAAEIFKGWIRAVQHDSNAETAFDTASSTQVTAGFGYWRIIPEFEDSKSMNQTLKVERVKNIFTVLIDPQAQQPVSSDKRWAFVSAMVDRDAFEAEWPKADPVSWEQWRTIPDFVDNWCDEKQVRVAEYWKIKTKERTLVKLVSGHIGFKDELAPDIMARIKLDASFIIDEREVEEPQVMMYKISALNVLEVHEWKGKYIPIVRVVGNESDIQGKTIYSGLVRSAKDPCRMYDYCCTAEVEKVMLEPKAPYIMAVGQDESLKQEWDQANTQNLTRLHYNPISAAGQVLPPPRREAFAGVPAGIIAAKMSAEQDIQATTGVRFTATKAERVSDESGIALQELRGNTELGTYHYIDNYAKSLMFTGEILLDLAPYYLTGDRNLTIVKEDGKTDTIRVDNNSPVAYREAAMGDKMVKIFNPKLGKYRVTVTIGPNYATKRKESAAGQLEFMKVIPGAGQMMADIFAATQDWDRADEVSRRFAAAMPPQLVQPAPADIPPQVQGYIMSLKQQMMQMGQQIQQMGQALTEKETTFQLTKQQIDNDFEAKMAKIAADIMKAKEAQWTERYNQILETTDVLLQHHRAAQEMALKNATQ